MKLSIVVPARNEEGRIGDFLKEYCEYFGDIGGWEMIVVVNNTQDNTISVLKKFMKKYQSLRYLDYSSVYTGKGGAVHAGFESALGDVVGYVDADASTPASAFHELVEKLNGCDGVIASRWRKDSKINKKQPISRRVSSRVFNLLVRGMFGLNYTDTQCGAKVFTRKALKRVRLGVTNWAFDIDVLYQMKKKGFLVREIATTWIDREDSKLNVGRVSLEMLLAILRYRIVYSPFRFVVIVYDFIFGKGEKMNYRRLVNG